DASVNQIYFRHLFEYHGWNPGDDSVSCGTGSHDRCLPKFRSYPRTTIPRCNSHNHRSYLTATFEYNRDWLYFLFGRALVAYSIGYLQSMGPFLGAAQ